VQGTESCVEEVRGQTPEVFVVVWTQDNGALSDELRCWKRNQAAKALAAGYWSDRSTFPSHYKSLTPWGMVLFGP
jgi:hypothetical protein